MNTKRSSLVAAASLLLAGPAAQATLLLPGQTVVPELLTVSGEVPALDFVTGTYSYLSSSGLLMGTYEQGVVVDPFATYCTGCLAFFLGVTVDPLDSDPLTTQALLLAAFLGNYTGFNTSVGYVIPDDDANNISPLIASRTADGAAVSFSFAYDAATIPNSLFPGDGSNALVILTDALAYDQLGNLGLVGGTASGLILPDYIPGMFRPVAVPEPGTLVLLASGLLTIAATRRRGRNPGKPGANVDSTAT